MATDKEILIQFAESVLPELKQVAGRSFGASIDYEASEDSLQITGSPFISVLVDGRRPTKSGAPASSPSLKERIEAWIEYKGIQPKPDANGNIPSVESLAFMIARSIHKKGTLLFQRGGGNNIFDTVLTEARLNQLFSMFEEKYRNTIESDVLRELKKLE